MQLPVIHLNGSDPEVLLKGYRDAYFALRAAEEALRAVSPHGRDYYPAGDDAGTVAMREHMDRLEKAKTLGAEMLALAKHCQKAIDAKKKHHQG